MSTFTEDVVLNLPVLKDWALTFGDLWDCRTSSPVGLNIFNSNFGVEHLKVSPIHEAHTRICNTKTLKNLMKSIEIMGGLGCEILGGLLKIKADLEYANQSGGNLTQENISIVHNYESFKIRVMSGARDAFEEKLKNDLIDGKVQATHYVSGLTLGSETCGNLRIWQKSSLTNNKIGVKVRGIIDIVIAQAKVEMITELSLKDQENEIGTSLSVTSKPPIQTQPITLEDFQKMIENIGKDIENEVYFTDLLGQNDVNPYGIPIGMKLSPISELIPGDYVEKKFLVMKPDLEELFLSTLAQMQIMQNPNFVKNKILEESPVLLKILSDPDHQLSKDISQFEDQIVGQVVQYFREILDIFVLYKKGEKSSQDILKVIERFETKFDKNDLKIKINDFISSGRRETQKIPEIPEKNFSNVTLFTNQFEMNTWLDSENSEEIIKILIKTGCGVPEGVFQSIFDFSVEKIHIGIAYPSLHPDCKFNLTLKNDNFCITYDQNMIKFIVQILNIFFGDKNGNVNLFYKILMEILGIQKIIPQNELPHLLRIFQEFSDLNICENYPQTCEQIERSSGEDLKIILLLDGIGLYESVENFIILRKMLEQMCNLKIKWIIGSIFDRKLVNLGEDLKISTILILGETSGDLKGLITSKLDLKIVQYNLSQDNEINWIKFLLPKHISESLLEIFEKLHIDVILEQNDLLFFVQEEFNSQNLAKKLFMFSLFENNLGTMSILGKICLKNWPNLIEDFVQFGWNPQREIFSSRIFENIEAFSMKIEKYFENSLYPIVGLMKLAVAVIDQEINELSGSPENVENSQNLENSEKLGNSQNSENSEFSENLQNPHIILDPIKALMENPNFPQVLKDEFDYLSSGNFPPEVCAREKRHLLNREVGKFLENEELIPLSTFINVISQVKNSESTINFENCARLILYLLTDEERNFAQGLIDQNPFKLLSHLELISEPKYFMIEREFSKIQDNFGNLSTVLIGLLKILHESNFTQEDLKILWKNSKFLYLIDRISNNSQFIDTVFLYYSSNGQIADFLPQNLRTILKSRRKPMWTWDSVDHDFHGIKKVIEEFQLISFRGQIPCDFNNWLRNFLEKNEENVVQIMEQAEALYFWDTEYNYFVQPWDLDTVDKALLKIMKYMEIRVKNNEELPTIKFSSQENFVILKNHKILSEFWAEKLQTDRLEIHTNEIIDEARLISPTTVINYKNLVQFIMTKFKNCQDLGSFLSNPIKVRLPYDISSGLYEFFQDNHLYYHDILTIFFNCSDLKLIKNGFYELHRLKMAIPIFYPSIRDQNTHIFYPISDLKELFKLDIKDQLTVITCIRISNKSLGKTKILREILYSNEDFKFPENSHQISYFSLELGFVDGTFLNSGNCTEKLKTTMENKNSILLLNLHGNALNFSKLLETISKISTAVVIFWDNPDPKIIFQNIKGIFQRLKCFHVIISESDQNLESQIPIINIENLFEEGVKTKIVQIFVQAIDRKSQNEDIPEDLEGLDNICKIEKSEQLFKDLIGPISVRKIKDQILTLQIGKVPQDLELHTKLIEYFLMILNTFSVNSIENLSTFLESKSMEFGLKWKNRLADLTSKFGSENFDFEDFYKFSRKLEENELKLVHFIRELGALYENSENVQTINTSMNSYISKGCPIEIFKTNDNSINLTLLYGIFGNFLGNSYFIVSVIGYQNTEFLNGIFGQEIFCQNYGTLGVEMSILKFSTKFQDIYGGVHGIILINTQEICQISENKSMDRKLTTTLLMKMSNIFIINCGTEIINKELEGILEMGFFSHYLIGSKLEVKFLYRGQNASKIQEIFDKIQTKILEKGYSIGAKVENILDLKSFEELEGPELSAKSKILQVLKKCQGINLQTWFQKLDSNFKQIWAQDFPLRDLRNFDQFIQRYESNVSNVKMKIVSSFCGHHAQMKPWFEKNLEKILKIERSDLYGEKRTEFLEEIVWKSNQILENCPEKCELCSDCVEFIENVKPRENELLQKFNRTILLYTNSIVLQVANKILSNYIIEEIKSGKNADFHEITQIGDTEEKKMKILQFLSKFPRPSPISRIITQEADQEFLNFGQRLSDLQTNSYAYLNPKLILQIKGEIHDVIYKIHKNWETDSIDFGLVVELKDCLKKIFENFETKCGNKLSLASQWDFIYYSIDKLGEVLTGTGVKIHDEIISTLLN